MFKHLRASGKFASASDLGGLPSMTRFSERSTRRLLLAGVSAIALTTMSSQIQAADIAPRMVTKAPPPVVQDRCNWWIEGGGFDTAGSYNPFGARPGWGGEGAIGFDCRPAAFTPYVLQGQFRYGEAKRSSVFSQP